MPSKGLLSKPNSADMSSDDLDWSLVNVLPLRGSRMQNENLPDAFRMLKIE
jgi:hypothetical protein